MTYEVRPMLDDDVPAVVDLLHEAIGAGPGGVDRRALFEWKHLRNPFGRSIAFVAEAGGRVVGLRAFMRWEFDLPAGTRVKAVRAVDTATAPDFQRRGIFSALTKEGLRAAEEDGVSLVFNTPNRYSLPGYLKMGWREVARMPVGIRLRRPIPLGRAALRRELSSGVATDAPKGSRLVPAGRALEGGRLPGRRAAPGLATPRTLGYLAWRYVDGPFAYHAALAGGAMAIGRLRLRGPLRECVVAEVLAPEPPSARAALSALVRESGCDHAVAHFGGGQPAARAAAFRAGFLRLPKAAMTFTVRPLWPEAAPPAPDPLVPASWSLSLGDLEIF